jgi:hypothetical protein
VIRRFPKRASEIARTPIGCDLDGFDNVVPVDAGGSLLFDVGTTTTAFGQYPLFGIRDGGCRVKRPDCVASERFATIQQHCFARTHD